MELRKATFNLLQVNLCCWFMSESSFRHKNMSIWLWDNVHVCLQASFVASGNRTDISLDDPNFWDKWAKKADIDTDEANGRVCTSPQTIARITGTFLTNMCWIYQAHNGWTPGGAAAFLHLLYRPWKALCWIFAAYRTAWWSTRLASGSRRGRSVPPRMSWQSFQRATATATTPNPSSGGTTTAPTAMDARSASE